MQRPPGVDTIARFRPLTEPARLTHFMFSDLPTQKEASPWRFCTAPMMDWSDRHCRYFWRLLSRRARLYTEMVTTGALIHGDRQRFLQFHEEEAPIALQLGGSNPGDLARCAKWAEDWGYDEVNLNCGCPSDRVQNGAFGACLMGEASLVRDCISAMRSACAIDVTVKHRIGIDHMESYEELCDFVGTVAEGGSEVFIVHARKAWLKGLSPKENREVPPLNYPWVYQLKEDFPELTIVMNGGIESLEDSQTHLGHVDGVMLGRSAYHNPWVLAEVDHRLFGDVKQPRYREDIIEAMLPYVEKELAHGARLNQITRHLLGLYQEVPGARRYRRLLSEQAHRPGAGADVLRAAVNEVTRLAA
ncbi:tRNA dihydrouridine(20/20a) synthase DusA [Congregibacter litoralis]|uniref:tRNA dihydrouridine(20/20a) synthase DusA n=1 Tax=Congregibacter litoralis TaxID=393662 RepID=UPI00006B9285